jgi:hypothetical protein
MYTSSMNPPPPTTSSSSITTSSSTTTSCNNDIGGVPTTATTATGAAGAAVSSTSILGSTPNTNLETSNDDEDAVLVDSFFLPGGLLADDEDNTSSSNTNNNKINNNNNNNNHKTRSKVIVVSDGEDDDHLPIELESQLLLNSPPRNSIGRSTAIPSMAAATSAPTIVATSTTATTTSATTIARTNIPSNPWENPKEYKQRLVVPPLPKGLVLIPSKALDSTNPDNDEMILRIDDGVVGPVFSNNNDDENENDEREEEDSPRRISVGKKNPQYELLQRKTLLRQQQQQQISPPPGFQGAAGISSSGGQAIKTATTTTTGGKNDPTKNDHPNDNSVDVQAKPADVTTSSSNNNKNNNESLSMVGRLTTATTIIKDGDSCNSIGNLHESATMEGEILQMRSISTNNNNNNSNNATGIPPSTNGNNMATNWDFEFSGPFAGGLNNRTIQRPLHSERFQHHQNLPSLEGRGIEEVGTNFLPHGENNNNLVGAVHSFNAADPNADDHNDDDNNNDDDGDGDSHVTPVDKSRRAGKGNVHNDDNDDDYDDDAGGSYREFLSPLTTDSREVRKFIDFGLHSHHVEEEFEEEEEDDDESDDPEQTDIPMDIHENSLDVASHASSLSSSSSDSDHSDNSSHPPPPEAYRELDVPPPDEPIVHAVEEQIETPHDISQIVEIIDEADRTVKEEPVEADDNTSQTVAQSVVRTPEKDEQLAQATACLTNGSQHPQNHHQQPTKHDAHIPTMKTLWQKVVSFSFALIVHYPSKAFLQFSQSMTTSIRQSQLYSIPSRQVETLNRRMGKAATWLRDVCQWFVDFKDVLAALVSNLLMTVRTYLATITNTLILIASFLFQVWKFSLIEAVEESSVTICYLVFYFMPNLCSLLMRHMNLPHWTPHIMTWVGVFSLCHQVKAGPLLDDDISIFRLSSTLTMNMAASSNTPDGTVSSASSVPFESTDAPPVPAPSQQPHQPQQQHQPPEQIRPRDERACRTILRILRFVLPVFFLADGFSSEFGTIMGVSGASRLTTAFMMSLVRKNLVSSPIGWVSWSIQVLLATYYPHWTLLDIVVLVVGLSSIRLIRYLDGQRLRKRQDRRSMKND